MPDWTIYYNPKCGSCRKALEILRAKKINPHIVEYVKTPPTLPELKELAKKLGDNWKEMIRTKEPVYESLKLGGGEHSQNDLLKAIADNPILLQRPLVVRGNRAMIARPPEKIQEIL